MNFSLKLSKTFKTFFFPTTQLGIKAFSNYNSDQENLYLFHPSPMIFLSYQRFFWIVLFFAFVLVEQSHPRLVCKNVNLFNLGFLHSSHLERNQFTFVIRKRFYIHSHSHLFKQLTLFGMDFLTNLTIIFLFQEFNPTATQQSKNEYPLRNISFKEF